MAVKFKSLAQLEKQKEAAHNKYNNCLYNLYSQELYKILLWFHDKFPKHSLKWVDGMGTNFWEIDGEIWDCDTEYVSHVASISGNKYLSERPWTRKEKLLAPLVNFQKSINDLTWCPNGFTTLGDRSTAVYKS